MTTNSTEVLCQTDDKLCIAREHQLEVIVVPSVLLILTFLFLLTACLLRFCQQSGGSKVEVPRRFTHSSHRRTKRHHHHHRHHLTGIDAPPGIDPLEHEEVPMTVQQQNVKPALVAKADRSPEGQQGGFSQVTSLPLPFSGSPNDSVRFYRAHTDNRDVVLRVLKENANNIEKQDFLGFANFLSRLGPHPFIPALLEVVSTQSPLVLVVEELAHRDLLGFLWRCRQENSGCEMTEKRVFTMAGQVASAMEYLHSQRCIHGNIGARSVLVGADMTAKLWGLGSAYRRRHANTSGREREMKKWQAPEVLIRGDISQNSDVWSLGLLLYEMVTLGDPPFADVAMTQLLQHLQRGRFLKRPRTCSNSLFSIMKGCCHWTPEHRLSTSQLIQTLHAGEAAADSRHALRAAEPLAFDRYIKEAGLREEFDYAVL